ncbi:hypothetical protein C5167_034340 [Papaver somniferum]|uniref:Uncharacterized protein n=1 Tax=Papaver somniferum TaxID=3469 RepID=A0A4Y7KG67_PAPSO|nr:hypothetical protein C5167_034340 [Papaver somniferum]
MWGRKMYLWVVVHGAGNDGNEVVVMGSSGGGSVGGQYGSQVVGNSYSM